MLPARGPWTTKRINGYVSFWLLQMTRGRFARLRRRAMFAEQMARVLEIGGPGELDAKPSQWLSSLLFAFHLVQELPGAVSPGIFEDFAGESLLDDHSVGHQDDPVRHATGETHLVSHDDHGHA